MQIHKGQILSHLFGQRIPLISGGAISPVSWICAIAITLPLKVAPNRNGNNIECHLLKLPNLHKYHELLLTNYHGTKIHNCLQHC